MSDNVMDLINALADGDTAAANNAFNDELAARQSAAIEAEKIAVAQSVYGTADEIESDTSDEEWDELADDTLEDIEDAGVPEEE